MFPEKVLAGDYPAQLIIDLHRNCFEILDFGK